MTIFFGLELVVGAEICLFGGILEISLEGLASDTETMDFLSASTSELLMFELLKLESCVGNHNLFMVYLTVTPS